MIKKWVSEKFFSTQSIVQQMKITVRDRKIWIRAVENQKIRMCSYQAACCSSQDREYNDHLNKNRQNWFHSILKQNVSIQNRIFCLSMWLSKRNHNACNRTLLSFCWNKTSNNRFMHRSSEHQKSHQQLRKNLQAD